MPCYYPLTACYDKCCITENGRHPLRFFKQGEPIPSGVETFQVACGQCIGCRLKRAREWAVRCMAEASFYERNIFITLTYDDENLPSDFSLHKDHFQKFMKRLRKRFPDEHIRFFHCGEYGSENLRPHYHAILFNFDFPDKYLFQIKGSSKYYRSPILEELWPFGYSMIGDCTYESCAYVARYIMKKVNGEEKEEHYHGREPEYITMSRRPGIAYMFYESFLTDIYPSDIMIDKRGKKSRPPRYFDKLLECDFPLLFSEIKDKRIQYLASLPDEDLLRLMQRQEYAEEILKKYERPL